MRSRGLAARIPVHQMRRGGFGRENPAPTIIPCPVFVGGGDLDAPRSPAVHGDGVGAIHESPAVTHRVTAIV